MHRMKIIFENFGKLVLNIEIDLGREPKTLSKMDIFKKLIFSPCNTTIHTNF